MPSSGFAAARRSIPTRVGQLGPLPSVPDLARDYNTDEVGLQGMADCAQEGGQWEQDYTSVTVDGGNLDDVGTTIENGQQVFPEVIRNNGWSLFLNRVQCANNFANNHSLAAAFGAQNTFVGQALGGNIFSGIGGLVTAVAGNGELSPQDAALTVYGGASLGIPVPGNHPGLNGAGGMVQDAIVEGTTATAVNAFTGASTAPVSVITGEAVAGTAAQLSTQTLEDVASGVGWLKLAGDAAIYGYGYFFKCQ